MINEDYLPCRDYEGQSLHPSESGFAAFFHESSERHFFALLDADGKVLLKSEGYPQAPARENGIQSVIKNRGNRDFYSVKEEDGRYFLSLRAANYREIARSCSCDSEADAWAVLDYATGEKVRQAVVATAAAASTAGDNESNKVEDDYLACKQYAGHDGVDADGLVKFQNENGQYYFAWYDENGDVFMRSEGYPTTAARDNGMASVLKNRDLEARYSVIEKMGRYFIALKAGNHQEIAKSCPYTSEAAALAHFPEARAARHRASFTSTDAVETATVVGTATAASFAADAVAETTHEVVETAHEAIVETAHEAIVETAHEAIVVEDAAETASTPIETTTHEATSHVAAEVGAAAVAGAAAFVATGSTEVETPHVETTHVETAHVEATHEAVVGAVAPPTVETVVDVEDDYLPCKEYEGRAVNDKKNNVALFKHSDGQFYFAIYDAKGGVRLRSEGFRTAQDRDKELSGALINLNNPDFYTTITRGAYSMQVLKDKTGREVGRSCLHKEAPVVATSHVAAAAGLAATAAAAVVIDTPKVEAVAAVEPPKAAVSADVEDDYLACREYESRNINDKVNNVSMFKHENGQYYFAIYNTDGSVRIRSEGFRTSQDRDKELSGALRNLNNADMYKTIKKGNHFLRVLMDKTGREVGRSCLMTDEPAPIVAAPTASVAPAVAVAAAAAAATAFASTSKAAHTEEVKVEAVKPVEVVKHVAATTTTTAQNVVADVAEEATGGFKWWWLLLPLLLGALWFLKDGCNKEVAAPTPAAVPVTPTVDTVKAVVPAATAPMGCAACSGASTDPIFTSECVNPKKLSRLGTNPEFGNSHALSPEQFYAKLKKAYADNEVDKVFLDRVYKAMGYKGFADAKADQFSAVVLPVGTSGKLGYSKLHKTGCYTLPDDEFHRKAFHITAANGCDLHFMKTCGNHFFFCK
jgi:uncharacterized protein YegP (UPF0339 family)